MSSITIDIEAQRVALAEVLRYHESVTVQVSNESGEHSDILSLRDSHIVVREPLDQPLDEAATRQLSLRTALSLAEAALFEPSTPRPRRSRNTVGTFEPTDPRFPGPGVS